MISTEIKYRHGLLNLLHRLKRTAEPDVYNHVISELDKRLNKLPSNNLEESSKFFFEMTMLLLDKLGDKYDVTHRKVSKNNWQQDQFTLKMSDDYARVIDFHTEWNNRTTFTDQFLRLYDPDFWRETRNYHYVLRLKSYYKVDKDGEIVLEFNKFKQGAELFFPVEDNGRMAGGESLDYFSSLYKVISSETRYLDQVKQHHDKLTLAVTEFKKKIDKRLKEEQKKFEMKNFKMNLLIKSFLPVSLLENENLKAKCEGNGIEVFYKKPKTEDFVHLGATYHVYSSTDLNDDSSYKIVPASCPVIKSDDLVYHGIGQLTAVEKESPRSNEGKTPYVINRNLFAGLHLEDCLNIFSKKILNNMKNCENLIDGLGESLDTVGLIENNPFTNKIISFSKLNFSSREKLSNAYINLITAFEAGEEEAEPLIDDLAATPETDDQFEENKVEFNAGLIRSQGDFPYPFALFEDESNQLLAIKQVYGMLRMKTFQNATEAIEALELPDGLYSVYSFKKRFLSRGEALCNIIQYKARGGQHE